MAKDAQGNVVDIAKIRGRDGSRCAGQPQVVPPLGPPIPVIIGNVKPVKVETRVIPKAKLAEE